MKNSEIMIQSNAGKQVFSRESGLPGGSVSKESACSAEDQVRSESREDALGKEMATHSSILACKIPQTEKSLLGYSHQSWTQLSD